MLKKVDLRCDSVPFLDSKDECYYFLDYTLGGYQESESNSIVLNFKKDLVHKDNILVWNYRTRAINFFASAINDVLRKNINCNHFILIPCPTSKPNNHPNFNDRLLCVAHTLIHSNPLYKVYNCFNRTQEVIPVHQGGARKVEEIIRTTKISLPPTFLNQESIIVLFDDVLTTGAHFKACQKIIMREWGVMQENIIGFFLAKTQHIITPIEDIDFCF